jgi:hypothetical protein
VGCSIADRRVQWQQSWHCCQAQTRAHLESIGVTSEWRTTQQRPCPQPSCNASGQTHITPRDLTCQRFRRKIEGTITNGEKWARNHVSLVQPPPFCKVACFSFCPCSLRLVMQMRLPRTVLMEGACARRFYGVGAEVRLTWVVGLRKGVPWLTRRHRRALC